jgi:hypothetical protein
MRNTIIGTIFLILAAQLAMAGAGNDQPTNIVVTNPYSNNVSWAQFCWSTSNQSDSLVMLGESGNFSRQAYDPTITTHHCVVVKNLEPATPYYYSVASCTDPIGGKQCAVTDTHWSSAPWPTSTPSFTTANSTSGPMAFSAFAFGPSYVYQGAGINVGISLIQKSGQLSGDYAMLVTEASIDGFSCLPGTLLGANCGNTGISLAMLCDANREEVNSDSDNYPVFVFPAHPYTGAYFCWSDYFQEPGMEARIVTAGGNAFHPLTLGTHTLRLIFQLVDYTQNNIPIGDPQTLTYKFSVVAPPQFTVTPPINIPPLPDLTPVIDVEGAMGCRYMREPEEQ